MAKKKRGKPCSSPFIPDAGLPCDADEFEPVTETEATQIGLGQAATPAAIAEYCRLAELYCDQAQMWLDGPPGVDRASEGVAKSALRDAIVCLANIWLGLPGRDALILVRRFLAKALAGEDATS